MTKSRKDIVGMRRSRQKRGATGNRQSRYTSYENVGEDDGDDFLAARGSVHALTDQLRNEVNQIDRIPRKSVARGPTSLLGCGLRPLDEANRLQGSFSGHSSDLPPVEVKRNPQSLYHAAQRRENGRAYPHRDDAKLPQVQSTQWRLMKDAQRRDGRTNSHRAPPKPLRTRETTRSASSAPKSSVVGSLTDSLCSLAKTYLPGGMNMQSSTSKPQQPNEVVEILDDDDDDDDNDDDDVQEVYTASPIVSTEISAIKSPTNFSTKDDDETGTDVEGTPPANPDKRPQSRRGRKVMEVEWAPPRATKSKKDSLWETSAAQPSTGMPLTTSFGNVEEPSSPTDGKGVCGTPSEEEVADVMDAISSQSLADIQSGKNAADRTVKKFSTPEGSPPESAFASVEQRRPPQENKLALKKHNHSGTSSCSGSASWYGKKNKKKRKGISIMAGSTLESGREHVDLTKETPAAASKRELLEDPIEDVPDSNKELGVHAAAKARVASSNGKSSGISAASFHAKQGAADDALNLRLPRSTPQRKAAAESARKTGRLSREEQQASGDDDFEFDGDASRPDRFAASRSIGMRGSIDVVRIAIGRKIFSSQCEVKFGRSKGIGSITLSYQKYCNRYERPTHTIRFDDDSIIEIKYYLAGDDRQDTRTAPEEVLVIDGDAEDMTLLVMRIKSDDSNGLNLYSKSYTPEDPSAQLAKQYIAVEFRSDKDFLSLLKKMRSDPLMGPFVDSASKLEVDQIPIYAAALLREDEKENEHRRSSPRKRQRKVPVAKSSNKLVLVYPFAGARDEIEKAAEDLLEASLTDTVKPKPDIPDAPRNLLHIEDDDDVSMASASTVAENGQEMEVTADPMDIDESTDEKDRLSSTKSNDERKNPDGSNTDMEESEEGAKSSNVKGQDGDSKEASIGSRAHFVTICEEDRDRCQPGQYLNDTLIDFWMQWLCRKEDKATSPVHVFSSHFYSTLSEGNGLKAVTTWTAKKNIDIFTKRFIFIPVNKSLHWSLCVVVNPGAIENGFRLHEGKGDIPESEPVSCILFLDSLKAHKKRQVAIVIRKWLNSEWKRLQKESAFVSDLPEYPFTEMYMPVYDPRIPYQDNGWDCGVFVCRYGYALYQIRHEEVTVADLKDSIRSAITMREEFQFGMSDIARLRKDIGTLIDRLSKLYLEWKSKAKADQEGQNGEKVHVDVDEAANPEVTLAPGESSWDRQGRSVTV